jgi:hypothetical protein
LGWGQTTAGVPEFFHAVPCLADDLYCLQQLFSSEHPPIWFVRYGFGSSFSFPDGQTQYHFGSWGQDFDDTSSNFRELLNLVLALENGVTSGLLANTEVFVFTDNVTAESCFYKGDSPSRTLFDLILHLRRLEMSGALRLHMVHVAGSRMIAQHTNGLSQEDLSSGIMASHPMLLYILEHLPANL